MDDREQIDVWKLICLYRHLVTKQKEKYVRILDVFKCIVVKLAST